MMKHLREMCGSTEALAQGLAENANQHRRYKTYTSMLRAMQLLLTGCMYLSTGSSWNDKPDREQMSDRHVYGSCFSYSTVENIAMWMLYGGDRGKSGAMLDFPQSVMRGILQTNSVELGCFEACEYIPDVTLKKPDFEIHLTDVLYVQPFENKDKVRITLGEEHEVVDRRLLDSPDIFIKHYAWSYERECRLLLSCAEEVSVDSKRRSVVRLKLPEGARRKMLDNLYRSPVYTGDAVCCKKSVLFDKVDWSI